MTPVDITTQWNDDGSSASVVNHGIVTEPNIKQPGARFSKNLRKT